MGKILITVNNFNYVVNIPSMKYKYIIDQMLRRLSTYGFRYDYKTKRTVRELSRVYASEVDHKMEYRFHINTLKDFVLTLGNNGLTKENVEIVRNGLFKPDSLDLEINPKYKLRPHQVEYENLTIDGTHTFKLVDLIMGGGKSLISMSSVVRLNMVTVILVLPKFMDKWYSDVLELTNATKEDMTIINGSKKLTKVTNQVMTGDKKYKFFIISVRTMYNYIKAYETLDEDEFDYPVTPDQLLETLKVGIVVNDETHMEFHSVFRSVLFLNTHKFIGMSATLEDNDKTQTRMYNIMFPGDSRISGILKHVPYVDVYAVRYSLRDTKYITFKRAQGYNHNLYEQSIMNSSVLLRSYIDMIEYYIKEGYISRKVKGDKCVIYVASVKLATILTNYLYETYTELDVRRYTEDDPYENIIEADMTVTTVISAGVALDIPNLITLISTISVRSVKAIKQLYGRLRNIEGKVTRYYTLYTKDIPNQDSTYWSNKEDLKPLAKTWTEISYDKVLATR